eukprot:tig00021105_g18245.t1
MVINPARQACMALEAGRRWCLTGTPIQNRVSDLHSLLAFLRYEPWADVRFWNRFVQRPHGEGDPAALERLRAIAGDLVLRRTKAMRDRDGAPIAALPPRTVETVLLDPSEEERDFYEARPPAQTL